MKLNWWHVINGISLTECLQRNVIDVDNLQNKSNSWIVKFSGISNITVRFTFESYETIFWNRISIWRRWKSTNGVVSIECKQMPNDSTTLNQIWLFSEFLSYLFDMVGENPELPSLECIVLLIRYGTEQTLLSTDLPKYLTKAKYNILEKILVDKSLEVDRRGVYIVLELVKNVSGRRFILFAWTKYILFSNWLQRIANHRIEICRFTKTFLKRLINVFEHHADDAMKMVLSQIFHLCIVAHYPRLAADADPSTDVLEVNKPRGMKVWNNHLLAMESIVNREIEANAKSYNNSFGSLESFRA